jgi:flagellar protein FlgJ
VLIAQSAQETGWGRHVVHNAYFGIKGHSPDGGSVDFKTTEVINGKVVHETDTFRAYTDFADAADDYGRLLSQNSRYSKAFLFKTDPDRFVHEIAKAGYATDPTYAQSLISIIHSHGLAQYDK